MMRLRLLAATASLAIAAAGCGDEGGGGGGGEISYAHTVAGLRGCLSAEDRFVSVEPLTPHEAEASALSAREERVVSRATAPSTDALVLRAGGPMEHDGVVSEAPVSATRLYLFADAGAAQRAADRVAPLAGDPAEAVLNGVRPLGRALVVHYSFGIGDRPGGVPLDADALAPVERCLRATGYA